ncbi:FAD binding domain-containing protein [candidate division KSB1 bacterium]
MFIPEFNYYKPETIEEAYTLVNEINDPGLLAGGTDLLVEIKQGKRSHNDIISLTGIEELKKIIKEGDKIYIGAGVIHNEILNSPLLKEYCSALCDTARNIATEQIRNTATLGGNLCTAASCCDMAPILISLGAEIDVVSTNGERVIPLSDFFTGHRTTALKRNEILYRIKINIPSESTSACYKKFGIRDAASIAVASVACMIKIENDTCTEASIVLGAVAPAPKLSGKAAALIKGRKLNELTGEYLAQIGEAAAADSQPINDIRGTAGYRKELVKILTIRAIEETINNFGKK